MSRKYLNDKYCVRCGRNTPTPYLRDNFRKLVPLKLGIRIADIGCGNGRNSKFLMSKGFVDTVSLDMVNDFGKKCILGKEKLPLKDNSVHVILCNYLLMFLNKAERKQLIREIKRIASKDCSIMVELYAAKDSECTTKKEMLKMQKQIFDDLGWGKVKYSQGRFIAKKE
jgi:SAM-dependent methyltransferase